jgi:RNA polymerase sigma-70 factor (ECF subfamily)
MRVADDLAGQGAGGGNTTIRVSHGSGPLEQRAQLDRFFAASEQRAFAHARYALGDPDDALDAVQDAMLSLVRRYAQRPQQEWPGLFYRILENRIRDMQRHRVVRRRVLGWLPGFADDDESGADPMARAPDDAAVEPSRAAAGDAAMASLYRAVQALPRRQRDAFVLRSMHELSVDATAATMGVTSGSVKTHYSRAVRKLREQLQAHWK